MREAGGGAHGSRPNQAAEKTCFPSPPDSLSFVCAFSAPPYSACLCLPFHAFFQAMLPASHYAFPCQTYGTSCGSPLLLCPCVPELSAVFSKARPCSWAVRHATCESPSPSELSLGGRRVGGSQPPSCISSSASQRLTPSCRKESPFTYGLVGMRCPLPLWMLTWRGLPRLSVCPISGTDPPGSGQ